MDKTESFLTTREVAVILETGVGSVHQLVYTHKLKPKFRGLFERKELERFLVAHYNTAILKVVKYGKLLDKLR